MLQVDDAVDMWIEVVAHDLRLLTSPWQLGRPASKVGVTHHKGRPFGARAGGQCGGHRSHALLELDHRSRRRRKAQHVPLDQVAAARVAQRAKWQRVKVLIGHDEQPLPVEPGRVEPRGAARVEPPQSAVAQVVAVAVGGPPAVVGHFPLPPPLALGL